MILGFSFFFFSIASFSVFMGAISYFFLGLFVLQNLRVFSAYRVSVRECIGLLLFLIYISIQTLFSKEIFIAYYIKFFLLLIFSATLVVLYRSQVINKKKLQKAVEWYVGLHITTFFVQLSVYLLLGHYIDFNNMLRAEYVNTAFMSRDVVGMLIPIRATGVFSEPSFYAMAVLPFAAYLAYTGSRVLSVVAIGTCLLSLSAAAIIITIAWVGTLLFRPHARGRWLLLPLLLILFVVVGSVAYDRIFDSKDYDALGARLRVVNELIERPGYLNIFGVGYFYNEHGVNGYTGISPAGIRDSGMYFMILYSGGLIALVAFLFSLWFWFGANYVLLGVLIICLFKYGILSSVFWLFLTVFVLSRRSISGTS